MKKKHALALILALFTLLATGCAAQKNGQTTIVTSFYPMYVLTLNVTDGVDGVTVQNMAEQNVGCLHDYQLQTRDMVTLEGADALVINGGGMEQFMDKVISLRADLPVIDASEGIEMFPSDEEHDHDAHGHDDHDELYNAHVWLDPNRAMIQVQNIAAGLAEADPGHAEAYQKNAESYIARLTALNAELAEQLAPFAGAEIITFHEAFAYFADAYNLHVAGVIANEPGEEPSTRDIADTCDLVTDIGNSGRCSSSRSIRRRPPKPSRGRRALPSIRSTRAYPATARKKAMKPSCAKTRRYSRRRFPNDAEKDDSAPDYP